MFPAMLFGHICYLYCRKCPSFHANKPHVSEAKCSSIFRWTGEPPNFSGGHESVPPSLLTVLTVMTVGYFVGYIGKVYVAGVEESLVPIYKLSLVTKSMQ
jgi:hypothetical protein